MNKYFIGIIFLIFILFLYATLYADGNSLLSQQGKELSLTSDDGTLFKIRVKAQKTPANFLYVNGWRWGAEKFPRHVITEIRGWWGNEQIFIPVSAYIDLANPYEVLLKKESSQFHLKIKGGDAATSYEATIIFENGVLRLKRVVHGEFPGEAWEETRYSFNELDN